MEESKKREPLIIATGSKGVGKSLMTENKTDAFLLTERFMYNLKIGDSFKLNNKYFFVKRMGKFNSKLNGKSYKTLTLKTYSDKVEMFIDENKKRSVKKVNDVAGLNSLTIYFMGGFHGKPDSRQRYSDAKQYNFLRNIEGQLIVDLLNCDNPLHEMSEIYKIANQN